MEWRERGQLVKAKSWQCLWLCATQWVTGRWPVYGTAVVQLPPCHATMVRMGSFGRVPNCRALVLDLH